MKNSNNLFNEIGMAGVGLILIIIGIVLANSNAPSNWTWLCFTLGICFIAFAGARESQGNLQIGAGIISIGCFVASIIILLTSVH